MARLKNFHGHISTPQGVDARHHDGRRVSQVKVAVRALFETPTVYVIPEEQDR